MAFTILFIFAWSHAAFTKKLAGLIRIKPKNSIKINEHNKKARNRFNFCAIKNNVFLINLNILLLSVKNYFAVPAGIKLLMFGITTTIWLSNWPSGKTFKTIFNVSFFLMSLNSICLLPETVFAPEVLSGISE